MKIKMKSPLPFAQINIIKPNLAEVIVNSNITFDLRMVKQYHNYLISNLSAPFNLLINKKNTYNYYPEAQKEIANIPQINKMGIITYEKESKERTDNLISLPSSLNWFVRMFQYRENALKWLTQNETICLSETLTYLDNRKSYTKEERKLIRKHFKQTFNDKLLNR